MSGSGVSMAEGEAGRVFISYRRQETAWPARQLYDVLVAELGADRVFKDVDDIEPGDDFVEQIQSAVGSCQVLLALIGPQWLKINDARGQRRIDDPEDFVRLEVETALNRDDVRVIPILVDNAKMPTPQELPPGLAALARRQAVEINPVNFDTRRLLNVLNDTLNDARGRPSGPTPPLPPDDSVTGPGDWQLPTPTGPGSDRGATRRRTTIVAVAISIVLLVAAGVVVWNILGDPDGTAGPGPSNSTSALTSPSVTTSSDRRTARRRVRRRPRRRPVRPARTCSPTAAETRSIRCRRSSRSPRRPRTASRWKPTCGGPATTVR